MIAFASGGVGGGGGRWDSPEPRVVDEAFEYGKAVYQGRAGAPKQRYCLRGEEKPAKLKRKNLKPYKNTTLQALADDLVLCDMGDTSALAALDQQQASFLIYYLNKRFKLNLTEA